MFKFFIPLVVLILFNSAFAQDTDLEAKISGLTCNGILAGEPLQAPMKDPSLSRRKAGEKYRLDMEAYRAAGKHLEESRKEALELWQQFTPLPPNHDLDPSVIKAAQLLHDKGVELIKAAVNLDQLTAVKGELLNRAQEIRKISTEEKNNSAVNVRLLQELAPQEFTPLSTDLAEKMDADLLLKQFIIDEVQFVRTLQRTQNNSVSPSVAAMVKQSIGDRLQNDWQVLHRREPPVARLTNIRRALLALNDPDLFKELIPEKALNRLTLSEREAVTADALERGDLEVMMLQASVNLIPLPLEPPPDLRDAHFRRMKARESYIAYLVYRWPKVFASPEIPEKLVVNMTATVLQRLQRGGSNEVSQRIISEARAHTLVGVEAWFVSWWIIAMTLNPIHVVNPAASRAIYASDVSLYTVVGRSAPAVEIPAETKSLMQDLNSVFN
jgi:hypothetical protein